MIAATTIIENNMSIKKACSYTGINERTYYYRKNRNNIIKVQSHRISNETIKKIGELSEERVTYGYKRVWALLRNSGININRKTVYKVMKENNLTLPLHKHKNKTELKLNTANKPDQIIETDITYIATNNGMTYLMCLKDIYSKEWLGYNYNTSCTARDAINAVNDSIDRKYKGIVPDHLILRTDNVPQYISREFNGYLKIMNIKHEYIERETPTENGDIESFHNSIKTDYICINEINNYNGGKRIIENAFIDYNNTRPHSTLMYYSPLQFLDKWNNEKGFKEKYENYLKNLKISYRNRFKKRSVMKSVS